MLTTISNTVHVCVCTYVRTHVRTLIFACSFGTYVCMYNVYSLCMYLVYTVYIYRALLYCQRFSELHNFLFVFQLSLHTLDLMFILSVFPAG